MIDAWKSKPADEQMLPLMQAEHDEKSAALYLQSAIDNGQANQLLVDLNTLDGILRELGIQESHKDPIEVIRSLMQQPT